MVYETQDCHCEHGYIHYYDTQVIDAYQFRVGGAFLYKRETNKIQEGIGILHQSTHACVFSTILSSTVHNR